MLNKNNELEFADINKWAVDKLDILLEHEISYMIVKEA